MSSCGQYIFIRCTTIAQTNTPSLQHRQTHIIVHKSSYANHRSCTTADTHHTHHCCAHAATTPHAHPIPHTKHHRMHATKSRVNHCAHIALTCIAPTCTSLQSGEFGWIQTQFRGIWVRRTFKRRTREKRESAFQLASYNSLAGWLAGCVFS